MALTSLDDYIKGARQVISYTKLTSVGSTAGNYASAFGLTGAPPSGTGIGNFNNGIVPVSSNQGYPAIGPITNTGYLTGVSLSSAVAQSYVITDRVYAAGAFTFNANVTLTAQPSFASRIPNGNYSGTQIWLQAFATFTGNPSVVVTYTNQDGVTGRTTGVVQWGTAPVTNYMRMLQLQAGDTGVQKIESVIASVATVGSFIVSVHRELAIINNGQITSGGSKIDLLGTGAPIIYDTSAIMPIIMNASAASGAHNIIFEVTDV